jgi:hypothetical protein
MSCLGGLKSLMAEAAIGRERSEAIDSIKEQALERS